MDNRQLISVIIPCYNGAYLYESIDSVLMQDYPAIQLIIADDGSEKDPCGEAQAYVQAHNRGNIVDVRCLRSEENRGTVANLNHAMQVSAGDPIFTLAADDVFCDEHVLTDWTAAFADGNAHVAVGFRAVCNEDLSREYNLAPQGKQLRLMRRGDPRAIWKELCRDNFLFGCATARTRRCMEEYGPVPSCYRLIEDFPMNLRWYRLGAKVVFLERTVVKHRKGGASAASNVNAAYEQDTREIYRREVLPYVRFPLRWKLHMERKILLRRRERKYLQMRRKNPSLGWNLLCHLCYPEIVVKYIKAHWKKP